MAKQFPVAELAPLPNEVPLPGSDLVAVSLFSRLPEADREKVLRYPGYMRLLHVRQGDVICRQGEEGCTAFYILRGTDLYRVRQLLEQRQQEEGGRELAPHAETLDGILRGLPATVRAAWEAAERLGERQKQALEDVDRLKKARAALDQDLKKRGQVAPADAARRRKLADEVQAADAPLAEVLRESARVMDAQAEAQRNADFFRTADAARKRARAQELADADPALAALLEAAAAGEDDSGPPFAVVHLAVIGQAALRPQSSWLSWLGMGRRAGAAKDGDAPGYIPFDGPRDIDYRTRQMTLQQGELLGEMACLNRRPRSATVVAVRDGYLLEMLGNILDVIDKNPDYQREREETYKRRVLDLHLRDHALLRGLSDAEFARAFDEVRPHVELVYCKAGDLICDENDRADSLYLVRDGLVQIVKDISALLGVGNVHNWTALGKTLTAGTGPAAAVRRFLPEAVCNLLDGAPDAVTLPPEARQEVIYGLNEALKQPQFAAAPEFKELAASAAVQERVASLPAERAGWSEQDRRRLHRFILEAVFPPGTLARFRVPSGPPCILTYCSRGDFIGEMGVVLRQPRMASCVAYGQPRNYEEQKDLGRVELVRIPGEVFLRLVQTFPAVRQRVEQEIARRQQGNQRRLAQRAQAGTDQGLLSTEVARLGLVQGQRLMLIDLERCTRCDECVRACADSHEDGQARLFLLGPRFGRYLVPATCRSCLDPVCMIGCPVRSIQRGDDQEIRIRDWCIGCGVCAAQCPYDAIQMHDLPAAVVKAEETPGQVPVKKRAVVCDLCRTLTKPEPRCVYACPHEAAFRVEARSELPVH